MKKKMIFTMLCLSVAICALPAVNAQAETYDGTTENDSSDVETIDEADEDIEVVEATDIEVPAFQEEVSADSQIAGSNEAGAEDVSGTAEDDSTQLFYGTSGESENEDELVGSYYIGTLNSSYAIAVQRALNYTDSNMSELEKALFIHEYITSHCHYQYSSPYTKYRAYDCLVNGEVVCNGYSSAYTYLLKMLGVKSGLMMSDTMNHQWNWVNIGGNYYHADLTWDDALITKYNSTVEYPLGGSMKTYFLANDTQIRSLKHYNWYSDDDITCSSNTYNDYSWCSSSSSILKCGDGEYIYNNAGNLYMTTSLDEKGTALTSGGTSTAKPTVFYQKGLYYFNDSTYVYSYDYNTGKKTIIYSLPTNYTSSGAKIYGMTEHTNGLNIYGLTVTVDTGNALRTKYINTNSNYSDTVPISSISLAVSYDQDAPTYYNSSVGKMVLSVIVTPTYTTQDKGVTWSSSNTDVATVTNGYVTYKSKGSAVITATVGSKKVCYLLNDGIGTVFDGNFMDVPSSAYYYNPVNWAYEKGITTGTGSYTFGPKDNCTRAQVVTFLWRAMGSPEPTTTAVPFSDVSSTWYYYKPVCWAYENNITTGTTATTFGTNDPVTRGQFVTFLYRAMKASPSQIDNPFEDVADNRFYYKPILWAYSEGITTGKSDSVFDPNGTCTRAEVVTFLYRALN